MRLRALTISALGASAMLPDCSGVEGTTAGVCCAPALIWRNMIRRAQMNGRKEIAAIQHLPVSFPGRFLIRLMCVGSTILCSIRAQKTGAERLPFLYQASLRL